LSPVARIRLAFALFYRFVDLAIADDRCWRLDRLGRSLRHLILLLDDFQAMGVAFVSLQEGIDATTPTSGEQAAWSDNANPLPMTARASRRVNSV